MPTRKMLSKAVQFWWMHPENWHVDVDIAIRSLWRFEPSIYIVDTFFQVSSLCISRTYKLYQDHMIPLSNFGILLQFEFEVMRSSFIISHVIGAYYVRKTMSTLTFHKKSVRALAMHPCE
ncbi:hypothetical protein KC19_VG185500 [Ceratodon purpureus]|uniref:Uncharacterized protein n=1 Tax=Ceratodon purpureus TaxID=3225 RepID=A0A8T0HRY2_CERPU|nr:hypothetical protein KC19_VG185500 [Ceratodon purpureus]